MERASALLQSARASFARAEEAVARQETVLTRLRFAGVDTGDADALLVAMFQTLSLMHIRLRQLEDAGPKS